MSTEAPRPIRSDPTANSDLHLSELARGASLALDNALQLQREATVLYGMGSFSRALLLHQISLEECGKIEILGGWATSHLMGHPINLRKVASALASHEAKNFANAYMLPAGE